MPAVERTSQFFQIADTLRAQSQKQPFAPVQPPPGTKSNFTTQSAEVRKYLNATTTKLERLAKLATSKSVFDDPTQEIEELSFVVKDDIKLLHARVAELQRTINAKSKGTADNDQIAEHSRAVVSAMNSQLITTTTGFKDVLQSRADSMKSQHDRRGQFNNGGSTFGHALIATPSPAKGPSNMFANPCEGPGSVNRPLLGGNHFGMGGMGGGGLEQDEDYDDESCVINVPSMEQMQMVPSNSYGEARVAAVENIQKTMTELAEVFGQLNVMMQAQGELVASIDNNVEDTVVNVTAAQDMWVNYLERISSNRMLAIKIFSILLAFGLFFIVFLK